MGKYERDWADGLGKDTVNYFNDNSVEDTLTVKGGAKFIATRFPDADRLEWIGDGNYETPGDIAVYSNNTLIGCIEYKASKAKGNGTSANLGQKFFGMFCENGIGYTDWEKQDGVWDQRREMVE